MALVQFAGLASGIDSQSLIKALLDQQRNSRIKPLENKISDLKDTNTAFGELSSLLNKLKDTASIFRTLNGGGIAKQASSSDDSIVSASVSNSALAGSLDITVSSLASAGTLSFDDRFSDTSSALYAGMNDLAPTIDRTLNFTIGTGGEQESIDIELTSSSSLDSIVSSFNNQSSNATASVINLGTANAPSYALMIKSNNTGEELGTVATTVGSAITDSGSGVFSSYTINQATNAELNISGVSGIVERSSNSFSDLISGMTLNIQSLGSATINVENDATKSTQGVQDFIDAYNDVLKYINENDSIVVESDGESNNNIFGPLAKSNLDNSILSALRQGLSNSSISGSSYNILADLGITTNRSGNLDFDQEVFKEALADNSSDVNQILTNLGEDFASIGGTIDQFTRFGGLIDTVVNSQNSLITQYQDRINDLENNLSRQEEQLNARFARLEALIGKLQSQQGSLSNILSSI
jgi:flagellar hook-associated protein 2